MGHATEVVSHLCGAAGLAGLVEDCTEHRDKSQGPSSPLSVSEASLSFPVPAWSRSLSYCLLYYRSILGESKVDVFSRIPPNMCCAGSASNPLAPVTYSRVALLGRQNSAEQSLPGTICRIQY